MCIRDSVEAAKERLHLYTQRTIIFIDEIHRFNKGQQDVLLPYVAVSYTHLEYENTIEET